MKFIHTIFYLLFLYSIHINSQNTSEILVSNISEFNNEIKKAVAGTKIILKNGVWKNAHLLATGIGTKEKPIIIQAETQGQVILTGNSKLNISGKYIIISGLWFKNGNPTSKEVISFRKDSKDFAYNCRLTNCTISNYNSSDLSFENHWVDLWGRNNRVDHNNFTGKTNGGTTLVVWLKGKEHTENFHRIDHNLFGFRPDLGRNGGETIRIGTSTNSMEPSNTTVEFNTFKECNGEIEIISNKSGNNIFRNNLFLESEGTLTLRHGNNALVENNVFIGNNNKNTGGIRIINSGHVVRNNLIANTLGDDYRGPIVIMNGVPNSPLNRYHQVKNVDIQNNTIINCSPIQFGAGSDSEKTLTPINTVFANNLITNTNSKQISNDQDSTNGIQFFGNIADTEAEVNLNYFKKTSIEWDVLKGFPMPTSVNKNLVQTKQTENSPKKDITNADRNVFVAGAFNFDNTKLPSVLKTKTGPYWKPIIKPLPTSNGKIVEVEINPDTETIENALKKVGVKGTIVLNPGTYFIQKALKINGDITLKGKNEQGEIIIKSENDLEKGLTYFFRANEGSKLQLENLTLDGESKFNVKYALVSPDEDLYDNYSIFVNNCTFKNFTNSTGAVFKAYKGTSADTISVKNSKIVDNYRGLNISYEKSVYGKTNVDVIILYNTLFKNMDEFAVNYYRNAINPTTKGGKLIVDQCVFSKIYNTEKGYIIKTPGITNVEIKNSVFENCHEMKHPISISGSQNSIRNCLLFMSGTAKVSNNAIKENLLYKSPKWEDRKLFIPSKKSNLLKENNGVERIGLL